MEKPKKTRLEYMKRAEDRKARRGWSGVPLIFNEAPQQESMFCSNDGSIAVGEDEDALPQAVKSSDAEAARVPNEEARLASKDQQLTEKDGEIARLQKLLAERDATIRALRGSERREALLERQARRKSKEPRRKESTERNNARNAAAWRTKQEERRVSQRSEAIPPASGASRKDSADEVMTVATRASGRQVENDTKTNHTSQLFRAVFANPQASATPGGQEADDFVVADTPCLQPLIAAGTQSALEPGPQAIAEAAQPSSSTGAGKGKARLIERADEVPTSHQSTSSSTNNEVHDTGDALPGSQLAVEDQDSVQTPKSNKQPVDHGAVAEEHMCNDLQRRIEEAISQEQSASMRRTLARFYTKNPAKIPTPRPTKLTAARGRFLTARAKSAERDQRDTRCSTDSKDASTTAKHAATTIDLSRAVTEAANDAVSLPRVDSTPPKAVEPKNTAKLHNITSPAPTTNDQDTSQPNLTLSTHRRPRFIAAVQEPQQGSCSNPVHAVSSLQTDAENVQGDGNTAAMHDDAFAHESQTEATTEPQHAALHDPEIPNFGLLAATDDSPDNVTSTSGQSESEPAVRATKPKQALPAGPAPSSSDAQQGEQSDAPAQSEEKAKPCPREEQEHQREPEHQCEPAQQSESVQNPVAQEEPVPHSQPVPNQQSVLEQKTTNPGSPDGPWECPDLGQMEIDKEDPKPANGEKAKEDSFKDGHDDKGDKKDKDEDDMDDDMSGSGGGAVLANPPPQQHSGASLGQNGVHEALPSPVGLLASLHDAGLGEAFPAPRHDGNAVQFQTPWLTIGEVFNNIRTQQPSNLPSSAQLNTLLQSAQGAGTTSTPPTAVSTGFRPETQLQTPRMAQGQTNAGSTPFGPAFQIPGLTTQAPATAPLTTRPVQNVPASSDSQTTSPGMQNTREIDEASGLEVDDNNADGARNSTNPGDNQEDVSMEGDEQQTTDSSMQQGSRDDEIMDTSDPPQEVREQPVQQPMVQLPHAAGHVSVGNRAVPMPAPQAPSYQTPNRPLPISRSSPARGGLVFRSRQNLRYRELLAQSASVRPPSVNQDSLMSHPTPDTGSSNIASFRQSGQAQTSSMPQNFQPPPQQPAPQAPQPDEDMDRGAASQTPVTTQPSEPFKPSEPQQSSGGNEETDATDWTALLDLDDGTPQAQAQEAQGDEDSSMDQPDAQPVVQSQNDQSPQDSEPPNSTAEEVSSQPGQPLVQDPASSSAANPVTDCETSNTQGKPGPNPFAVLPQAQPSKYSNLFRGFGSSSSGRQTQAAPAPTELRPSAAVTPRLNPPAQEPEPYWEYPSDVRGLIAPRTRRRLENFACMNGPPKTPQSELEQLRLAEPAICPDLSIFWSYKKLGDSFELLPSNYFRQDINNEEFFSSWNSTWGFEEDLEDQHRSLNDDYFPEEFDDDHVDRMKRLLSESRTPTNTSPSSRRPQGRPVIGQRNFGAENSEDTEMGGASSATTEGKSKRTAKNGPSSRFNPQSAVGKLYAKQQLQQKLQTRSTRSSSIDEFDLGFGAGSDEEDESEGDDNGATDRDDTASNIVNWRRDGQPKLSEEAAAWRKKGEDQAKKAKEDETKSRELAEATSSRSTDQSQVTETPRECTKGLSDGVMRKSAQTAPLSEEDRLNAMNPDGTMKVKPLKRSRVQQDLEMGGAHVSSNKAPLEPSFQDGDDNGHEDTEARPAKRNVAQPEANEIGQFAEGAPSDHKVHLDASIRKLPRSTAPRRPVAGAAPNPVPEDTHQPSVPQPIFNTDGTRIVRRPSMQRITQDGGLSDVERAILGMEETQPQGSGSQQPSVSQAQSSNQQSVLPPYQPGSAPPPYQPTTGQGSNGQQPFGPLRQLNQRPSPTSAVDCRRPTAAEQAAAARRQQVGTQAPAGPSQPRQPEKRKAQQPPPATVDAKRRKSDGEESEESEEE